MAEIVENYKFKAERAAVDWDKYLDGQKWFLGHGVDVDEAIPVESFRGLAYLAAKRRNLKVRINSGTRDGVKGWFVQSHSKETESR